MENKCKWRETEEGKKWLKEYDSIRKSTPEYKARQKERDRLNYLAKKEKIKARVKAYEQANKDSIRKAKRKYKDNKEATDELYAFTESVRRNVRVSFSRLKLSKTTNTESIIGCSFEEFREHIKIQFKDGMTLDNHGKVWHLDHILPLAYAKGIFIDVECQKRMIEKLCHYTNYQPLFWIDNLSKGKKF